MQNNIIELSSGSSSSDDDAEQLLFQQKPKCTNNGYQRVEHKVKQRNKNARPGTSHQMDEERTSAPLPATASVTSTTTNAPITPNQKNIAGNFLFKNTDKQTTLINFIESKVKDELEKQMGDFKKNDIVPKGSQSADDEKTKTPQLECPVCFNPFGEQKLAAPKCGHTFCFECVKKAVAARGVCPSCSKKAFPNDLRLILLPR